MNNDENIGVALSRQKNIWSVRSSQLRRMIAWPMIIVFALGSVILWASAIGNLVNIGGFAGIISWQILGFFLPIYQGSKMYARVSERDVIGRFVTPPVMRRRLWTIIWIIWLNAAANTAAIILILINWSSGRLVLSRWDVICFSVVIGAFLLLLLWKRRQLLKSQVSMFFLAAGTRMMPQLCLAFSLDLGLIPWPALMGVAAIAGQRFIVSSIELFEAKSHKTTSRQSLAAAKWVWRGDVGNMMAITIPVVVKLFL